MAVDPNVPNNTKSWLRQLADNASQPSGIAGMGQGATPDEQAQAYAVAKNFTPPPTNQFAGVQGSATTVRDPSQGLRALAPGVTRYGMDKGNEAEVYATRGKDGSLVFTDSPAYAAAAGNGQQLQAGDTYQAAQRTSGPNAGFAYRAPSIAGLRRQDVQSLDDPTTTAALAQTVGNNSTDPEVQAANAIDRNLLTARQQTLRRGPTGSIAPGTTGAGGGLLSSGGLNGLTPSDQIQILKLQEADKRAGQANDIALAGVRASASAAGRAADSQERTAQQQSFSQLQSLKKTDPASYASGLVSQLESDPDALRKQLKSPQGQLIKNSLLQDVVQPGLQKSTYPLLDFQGRRAASAGQIDFGNLQLDPATGQPKGFEHDGSLEYPTTGFFGGSNFDPSLNRITPAMWRVLQEDGLNSKKAR